MAAVEAVGDAGDVGLRQEGAEEIEFGAAGVAVALGDRQDGAVVLGDDERAVRARGEIGQVAVLVEDLGDELDLVGEGQAYRPRAAPLQPPLGPAVEDARQQGRVLVLDVGEQLVGEVDVVAREEGVAGGREERSNAGGGRVRSAPGGGSRARRAPAR